MFTTNFFSEVPYHLIHHFNASSLCYAPLVLSSLTCQPFTFTQRTCWCCISAVRIHLRSQKSIYSKQLQLLENSEFCRYAFSSTNRLQKEHDRAQVLKIALYYSMVAVDFDLEDDVAEDPQMTSQSPVLPKSCKYILAMISHSSLVNVLSASTPGIEKGTQLTESDVRLCESLMTRVIDHFTPILFTPATTPHMGCTDVFADTWMTCVISPAIESGGVYRPIETLERMRSLDWVKHGLCSACVEEKDKEWREEQENVWNMIERWLGMEIIT